MSIDGISNHAYTSDEELMLWMQEKTGGLHDDLANAMDISDRRSGLVEDLTNFKSRIKNAKPEEYAQIAQEARAMLAQAEGMPGYEELQATLQPAINELESYAEWNELLQYAQNDPEATEVILGRDMIDWLKEQAALGSIHIPKATLDTWGDNIQARVDALGREDQLNLIRIGSLDKGIHQAEQITSNLIKSRDDARSAIIANMRA
jgi:hypothetical protein